jgi:hypothetical protein
MSLLKLPTMKPIIAYNYLYYKNSFILSQLKSYPIIQLTLIAFFALLSYFTLSASRRAEQNQVWVGMSKETAHQLGTLFHR